MKHKRWFFLFAAAFGLLAITATVVAARYYLAQRNGDVNPLPEGQIPQALRLTIYESGITAVTAEQLAEANLGHIPFEPENLALSRDGKPVPFIIQDEILYFYAIAITQTLEAPAVYWLTPGKGLPMPSASAKTAPEGVNRGRVVYHWEENNVFVGPALGDDVWFVDLLNAGETMDIPFTELAPLNTESTLVIQVWSNNETNENPDHHLQATLNDAFTGDYTWDGKKQQTISFTLGADIWQEAGNTLTLAIPGDTGALGEQVYIDWVELIYMRPLDLTDAPLTFSSASEGVQLTGATADTLIFDITNQNSPLHLTDLTVEDATLQFASDSENWFAAANPSQVIHPEITLAPTWPNSLQTEQSGADYLAIYVNAPGFQAAIQPLLTYRQEQGLDTQAIDVAQIYDEFGHGHQTTTAIRDFLTYAAANWQPAPRYVLLVGDASYDIHNFTNGKNLDLLPTHLMYTFFTGYVASDTWFVIPEGSTPSPTMAIGRLPAQTVTQLETMVAKTLLYEREADPSWRNQALLVADDEPYFDTTSDELASQLTDSGFVPQKLYMSQNEDIHDTIIQTINDGVGLINYVGHGSVEVWGDERVLQAKEVESLRNRGRFPIFTTFTCLNGYFNHPDVNALAESLLIAPNGGAVAAIAPSSRTTTFQQFQVANVFFTQLLSGEVTTIGEALQMAKQANAENENAYDVIYSFSLLGDPALHFYIPE
ncbi:MAG: C25 family cysteine peptidase [Candidatus Promineifilaceae bacterium]